MSMRNRGSICRSAALPQAVDAAAEAAAVAPQRPLPEPPGRYILQARGNDNDTPQFASQPLTVGSSALDVSVALADSATISGTIVFPPSQTELPDFSNMRVVAPSTDITIGGQAQGRVDK